jgi:hypothetical protein
MKFPVLNNHNKDADIIGYAETVEEAEAIAEKVLRDCGNDDDDIADLKQIGVLTYNLQTGHSGQSYDNIDTDDLKNGFFDNA